MARLVARQPGGRLCTELPANCRQLVAARPDGCIHGREPAIFCPGMQKLPGHALGKPERPGHVIAGNTFLPGEKGDDRPRAGSQAPKRVRDAWRSFGGEAPTADGGLKTAANLIEGP